MRASYKPPGPERLIYSNLPRRVGSIHELPRRGLLGNSRALGTKRAGLYRTLRMAHARVVRGMPPSGSLGKPARIRSRSSARRSRLSDIA
jgi:hypothetical protein